MENTVLKSAWHECICSEFRNWHIAELFFVFISVTAVIILTILTGGDSLIGIVSAVTGIMYTLLAGKGKRSCYLFGIVNSFLYGLIAMQNRIYGDMLLNWAWYFPMQFVGLWFWQRNYDSEKGEVKKMKLTFSGRLLFIFLVLAAWAVFALILERFDARVPWLDSATTVLSASAMILTVMRRFEQWLCWTLVNSISIFMWYRVYLTSGNSVATLMMWVVFFICGLVFAWQWYKGAEKEQ
jgi:nicotinamide mononucleotide transporter